MAAVATLEAGRGLVQRTADDSKRHQSEQRRPIHFSPYVERDRAVPSKMSLRQHHFDFDCRAIMTRQIERLAVAQPCAARRTIHYQRNGPLPKSAWLTHQNT